MGAPQGIERDPNTIANGTPTGAPPPSPTTTTPTAAAAPAPTPWYGEIADPELKGYAELRNWKSAEAALKSFREGEKLLSWPKDELLRLPKDAKPEDLAAVYDRLGRPAKPEDYKLPVIEGGENFAKAFTPVLHEMGLNQAQAEKLATAWNGYMEGVVKARDAEQAARESADIAELHNEWPGEIYTQRTLLAEKGAEEFLLKALGGNLEKALEVEKNMREAMGLANYFKVFSEIGAKIGGETTFKGSGSGPSNFRVMTPQAAEERLAQQDKDYEFGRRFFAGDPAAREERNNLIRIAAQGRDPQIPR